MDENGIKRNENGTFADGTIGGPGRPKGQSLKEFWKQRLSLMTEEEKKEWSRAIPKEVVWKMSEGMPQTDITSGGEKLPAPLLVNINDNNDSDTKDSEASKEN